MASAALRPLAPVMSGLERMSQMGLQQQLDAFKAEFARTAPAGARAVRRKNRGIARQFCIETRDPNWQPVIKPNLAESKALMIKEESLFGPLYRWRERRVSWHEGSLLLDGLNPPR